MDSSSCEANGSRVEIIEGDLISSDNLLKANVACCGELMTALIGVIGIYVCNASASIDLAAKMYCDIGCENVAILFAGFLGLS